MSSVLTKETLEGVGRDFVEQTKARLKQRWAAIPDQTKEDIESTAKFAAKLAARLAVGDTRNHEADYRHLTAQLAQIPPIAKFEVKMAVEEILEAASRLAGTFLQKAVIHALTSQGFKL